MTLSVYVIIVTHNSGDVLPFCLAALAKQTRRVDTIIVVDSGSTERAFLEEIREREGLILQETDNVGFGKANNIALKAISTLEGLVLFINPDTFLRPDFVERAWQYLDDSKKSCLVTGKLLAYDPYLGQPTGRLDSAGIFRKWYGRWYDRGQGEIDTGCYDSTMQLPAICGALLCCRLESFVSFSDRKFFDEDFFLYKEDIELSLRLKGQGWHLIYEPSLVAYHCRGWQKERRKIPYSLRIMAAENEILLYWKHPSFYMLWALAKYLAVRLFRI